MHCSDLDLRKQRLKSTSDSVYVEHSVPQDTVLGPVPCSVSALNQRHNSKLYYHHCYCCESNMLLQMQKLKYKIL